VQQLLQCCRGRLQRCTGVGVGGEEGLDGGVYEGAATGAAAEQAGGLHRCCRLRGMVGGVLLALLVQQALLRGVECTIWEAMAYGTCCKGFHMC
jgi:hypothetical protein